MDTPEIKKLLTVIEQQLEWGDTAGWQSRDFENLNQLIFDKTKVSLSASTLKRVWGRVEYNNLPSGTTLDTLARFAGFENWRAFLKLNAPVNDQVEVIEKLIVKPAHASRLYFQVAGVLLVLALIGLLGFHKVKKADKKINPADYSFSSQRLAKGIPNSVMFDYDASKSPTDSVYIQQSWDPHTTTLVSRVSHKHTSVYYEPGFYQAKLVIGHRIVKEHKLIIPTEGWLGIIENKPTPVYLDSTDFIHEDALRLPVSTIHKKNILMGPQPPGVKYYNIGNFTPVPLNNFSFNVKVKNEYKEGAAACQFAWVYLITDTGPIIIPLSIKGCVSDLNLISVKWIISGKSADFSGFGVDFSDWVQVSCKSAPGKIQYYVNDKLAYEVVRPSEAVKIVGMGFEFQGTGSVKNIELKSAGNITFKAF
jgi:hypothetical protein